MHVELSVAALRKVFRDHAAIMRRACGGHAAGVQVCGYGCEQEGSRIAESTLNSTVAAINAMH